MEKRKKGGGEEEGKERKGGEEFASWLGRGVDALKSRPHSHF